MTGPQHPLQETKRVTLPLPSGSTKDLLLLILLCDTPVPSSVDHRLCLPLALRTCTCSLTVLHEHERVQEKYGTYHSIFSTLFSLSAAQLSSGSDPASAPAPASAQHELTVESYDIQHGIYPDAQTASRADGILITGSGPSFSPLSLPSPRAR